MHMVMELKATVIADAEIGVTEGINGCGGRARREQKTEGKSVERGFHKGE
jgi:hypothetical protein